jgi:hypothetical protein
VRGRLALADIGSTVPAGVWLDAVYAAYADAPHQVLEQLNRQIVIKEAMIDPEGARETWGRRPEHAALAGKLGRGAGVEAGNPAAMAPTQRPGSPRRPTIPQTARPPIPGMPVQGTRPRPR